MNSYLRHGSSVSFLDLYREFYIQYMKTKYWKLFLLPPKLAIYHIHHNNGNTFLNLFDIREHAASTQTVKCQQCLISVLLCFFVSFDVALYLYVPSVYYCSMIFFVFLSFLSYNMNAWFLYFCVTHHLALYLTLHCVIVPLLTLVYQIDCF